MTRILTRGDIAALMHPGDYLEAVEAGFRALGAGKAETPPPLSIHGIGGAFHAKGAALALDTITVALKLNANFPGNPAQNGLPTIQGAILLCDGSNGALLAIMDSIELTVRRTAAATALAARYLARPDSTTVTICGCGVQAQAQLDAIRQVLPIAGGFCMDQDSDRAAALGETTGLQATSDLAGAARRSDVIITCTPSAQPFLTPDMVAPGAFIAAVGADAPHKSEITPDLMANATIVVDSLDQCAVMGDLHHAIAAGVMDEGSVHADLAQLVGGERKGRTRPDEITLFDSTGVAIQDVASALMIQARALDAGAGIEIELGQ